MICPCSSTTVLYCTKQSRKRVSLDSFFSTLSSGFDTGEGDRDTLSRRNRSCDGGCDRSAIKTVSHRSIQACKKERRPTLRGRITMRIATLEDPPVRKCTARCRPPAQGASCQDVLGRAGRTRMGLGPLRTQRMWRG